MPNFTPEGIIKIGRVPFDNSYRHTLSFPNVGAQTAYFASVCTESLSREDYTYVRMNNAIRVPFNAERLYTYDYVMYQNKNYGTKWFYAFITAVNYINENVTELVLELDVMQTWYFDYQLVEGFVEREHVDDDTIGLHLNDEPGLDMQYIYDDFHDYVYHYDQSYIILMVSAYPKYKTEVHSAPLNYDNVVDFGMLGGNFPTEGGVYQHMINGCKALIYNPGVPESLARFKSDIAGFNKSGCADAIADAYIVPYSAVQGYTVKPFEYKNYDSVTVKAGILTGEEPIVTIWEFVDNAQTGLTVRNIARPFSLNGYVPRNNKLLCYPYCYLELGDFSGRTEDLRWEYFTLEANNDVVLNERKAASSDCQGYVVPKNYNGITTVDGFEDAKAFKPFTFDFSNKVSWVYSTFQNWLAQNGLQMALTSIASVATAGFSVGNSIASAANVLGKAKPEPIPLNMDTMPTENKIGVAAGVGIGLGGLAGVAGQIYKMHRVPNTARGNTAGNSRLQNGFCGWYAGSVCIRQEFAQIMDDFFDCYGYAVERVKIPNRTGRRSWNYIKMQNACHRGNVPSSDMTLINEIYDKGITFWHTTQVGNYSLNNDII